MGDAERRSEQDGGQDFASTESPLPESPSCTEELEKQKKALGDLNDQFLRLAADFENFKKRTARERESVMALANERFAVDLLEVLDNFERALRGTTCICVKVSRRSGNSLPNIWDVMASHP